MTLYGAAVPWWRVVRSDGALLPGHELRALDRYREEGTPLRSVRGRDSMPRIDLLRARWDGNG
jgi:alkylated DNA nucleotide flippase Atl1